MAVPAKRAARKAPAPAARATKRAAAPRKRSPAKKSAESPAQAGVCTPPAEPETAASAVERAIAGLAVTPKRAVAVAQVRRLAKAFDQASKEADLVKVSGELAARMTELLAEVKPDGDDADWTAEGAGAPEVRDAT